MTSEQAKTEFDKAIVAAQDDFLAAFDLYKERTERAAELAVANGISDGDLMSVATGRAAELAVEIQRRVQS